MSRTARAILVLAVALAAALGYVRLHAKPSPPPAAGGLLGIAEPGELASYQQIDQFARAARRQPQIVLFYAQWREPFRARFAARVHAHGAVPFVQISPGSVPLAAIAAGRYDGYLRTYARQVRAYGYPVIVGFAPEMNGFWDSWGYRHTRASTWVAAWRHLVTTFRRQGATNVTWIWTINVIGRGTGPIRNWWPGSAYVDWVGIDGYYFQQWETFSNEFDPTVAAVRSFTTRPILLSEVAIGQVAGQSAKIPDLVTGVRADHLLGFVWFDETQHQGIYHQDWRLEGHPAAVAAFRRALRGYQRAALPGLASIRPGQ